MKDSRKALYYLFSSEQAKKRKKAERTLSMRILVTISKINPFCFSKYILISYFNSWIWWTLGTLWCLLFIQDLY